MDETITKVWNALVAAVGIETERPFALSKKPADALLQGSFARVFFIDRIIIRPERMESYLAKDYQSVGDALLEIGAKVSSNSAVLFNLTSNRKY